MKNMIFVAKFCILMNNQSMCCLLLSTLILLVSVVYTYVKVCLKKILYYDIEE